MCHKSRDISSQELFLNVVQEIWNNRIAKNSDLYNIDMFFNVFLSTVPFFLFAGPASLDIYRTLKLYELRWFQYEQI